MNASRTALVTGSTSGIGRGIAEALAGAGCKVMLNGFGKPAEIEDLRGAIADRHDTEVGFHGADLSDAAQVADLVAATESTLGPVDVLVNNAGIQHVAAVEEFPPEKWDAILAINLSAAFHLCRLTFGGMKQRGFGRVINIASAHGLTASPYKSAYVAAKHGIVGLTKTLAMEGAEHGVTVNAICPGYVLTPLVKAQIPDTAKSRGISEEEVVRDVLLAAQPTKKFVTVEQVASLAVYLAGESAASITGASLPVDGGWTAQ